MENSRATQPPAAPGAGHDGPDEGRDGPPRQVSRRQILKMLSAAGVGTVAFQRALAAQVSERQAVTADMIQQAEWIAGLELSEADRATTAATVESAVRRFEQMREVDIGYDIAPALIFQPVQVAADSGTTYRRDTRPVDWQPPQLPTDEEDLAFLPVSELAALLRTRKISSVELTKLYLDRLHRFDEPLKCVVSFMDDVALRQAARADREMAVGRYRGPLHGIPWGAKDLISYPGFPTTWGATPFREQHLKTKATVAARLEAAGAVLLAKLSLGALAWGDKWFGGMTRNPWNVAQGSSGSSAGSASATAAGLVGFTLGSETLGSIVSPCRRCGCTGLRPTFGRVSRYGCMSLAWSMDKIGPICRSVEDCALVFDAIHGRDGLDATVVADQPFWWPPRRELSTMKIGYVPSESAETQKVIEVLRDLGANLVPIELPNDLPVRALTLILDTEAAAVFDQLTRDRVTEGLNRWPPVFRQGQFVPAVEYLRANRIRTLLIRQMEEVLAKVDAYIGGNDLVHTNMTGHPTVVLPDGFQTRDGRETPTSLTMTGKLFGESDLLAIAHAYQQATGHHLARPDMSRLLEPEEPKEEAQPAKKN